MGSLFSGPLEHCRLLTFVMPANLNRLERERRRLAMSRPQDWERQGLMEEVRIIGTLTGENFLKTRHYLTDFNDTITAADLAYWHVAAGDEFPELPIAGKYREHGDYLEPVIPRHQEERPVKGWFSQLMNLIPRRSQKAQHQVDNTRHKCSILASYQLTRIWNWQRPLMQIIAEAEGPIVICIDVRRIHPERVTASAEFWEGMRLNGNDRQAALARQEAEDALNQANEAVHHVRILFMVLDKDRDSLRQRTERLRKTSAQFMKLDRMLGYQAAAARMFGPQAAPPGMPSGHYNTLSTTVAHMSGMWGVGREQETKGIYVGISASDAVSNHIHFLEWKGNDPFHGIILGRTGKGKTVAAQAMAWRMAEQGIQVIMLEPNGHSRRLQALAADSNDVSYHRLSYEDTQLNILDVVYEHETDQLDHVITLLALLLDPLGRQPRHFHNNEIAAIRRALILTYEAYDWEELLTDQTLTPTLTIFCQKLRLVAQQAQTESFFIAGNQAQSSLSGEFLADAALLLANEIESLYVHGDYAPTFNVPSNLNLRLQKRIVLFDFSRVPPNRRALFYYATLAGINLRVRRHPRKRAIFVDEVHYMTQGAGLMKFLANMVKTVRTFGAAVIMIDQDLEAFIGVAGAQSESMAAGLDVPSGQFILNNIAWLISFGLKLDAAGRLGEHYKGEILSVHIDFLARMGSENDYGKGMAVLRYGGKAEMVYFKLRPSEAEALFGS
jgi:hypothetical protein